MYRNWLRDHKEPITEELKLAYCRFCEHPRSLIPWRSDFGAFVGIPLFVLWMCWGYALETTGEQLIAGAVCVAFGFLVRYYQKHTLDLTLRYFFDRIERPEILADYIKRCAAVDAKENISHSTDFYEYCKHELITENFRYYEKTGRKSKNK